jgi:uncharacterized protein YjbI with pentapeptide repeats
MKNRVTWGLAVLLAVSGELGRLQGQPYVAAVSGGQDATARPVDAVVRLASVEIDTTTRASTRRQLLRDLQGGRGAGRDLRGADLVLAHLKGVNLAGADLRGAGLVDADLRGANLSRANLQRAVLYGADLRAANLSGASLAGAVLDNVTIDRTTRLHPKWRLVIGIFKQGGKSRDLHGADLAGAVLVGADLRNANLRGADLRRADLGNTDLRGADLRGADLRGAEIYQFTTEASRFPGPAVALSNPAFRRRSAADLTGAHYDPHTRWPSGFDPHQCGAILVK